jgi:hypothetical protein
MNKKNIICLLVLVFIPFLFTTEVLADDLILTGQLNGAYYSDENIITQDTCTVEPGASVTLQAAQNITLSSGFYAKAGSSLELIIGETTADISAYPMVIYSGNSSTLLWTTTNATSVSIDQGIGPVAESGSMSVAPISTITYTITAEGPCSTATDSVTVTVDTSPPPTHVIAASAGSGGTITPSGNVIVNEGSSQIFTITPDFGYVIDDVLVDGQSEGPVSDYLFEYVTADHTIHATFEGVDTDGDGIPDWYEIEQYQNLNNNEQSGSCDCD